jgi:hypothetical protein
MEVSRVLQVWLLAKYSVFASLLHKEYFFVTSSRILVTNFLDSDFFKRFRERDNKHSSI